MQEGWEEYLEEILEKVLEQFVKKIPNKSEGNSKVIPGRLFAETFAEIQEECIQYFFITISVWTQQRNESSRLGFIEVSLN